MRQGAGKFAIPTTEIQNMFCPRKLRHDLAYARLYTLPGSRKLFSKIGVELVINLDQVLGGGRVHKEIIAKPWLEKR